MANTPRGLGLLALVTLAAVLVAAAAVLLLGTPQGGAPGARTPPPGGQLLLNFPAYVWALLFLSPILVGWAGILLRAFIVQGRRHFPLLFPALLLLGLVTILLLVVLSHAGGGSGYIGYEVVHAGQNGTTSNNSSSNGTTPPPGGGGAQKNVSLTGAPLQFNLPSAALWLIALGLCGLVAVLTVPGVISRIADRRFRVPTRPPPQVDREAAAGAMAEAAAALERGEAPRETIIRLYLGLLRTLGPRAGELAPATPDEIRRVHLLPLGVPTSVAETLTRLFEIARYSSLPMDPETTERARSAMRAAEAALLKGAAA